MSNLVHELATWLISTWGTITVNTLKLHLVGSRIDSISANQSNMNTVAVGINLKQALLTFGPRLFSSVIRPAVLGTIKILSVEL